MYIHKVIHCISTVQVFDDLQLEAYDLNVDNLDVHAVRVYLLYPYTYLRMYVHISIANIPILFVD